MNSSTINKWVVERYASSYTFWHGAIIETNKFTSRGTRTKIRFIQIDGELRYKVLKAWLSLYNLVDDKYRD